MPIPAALLYIKIIKIIAKMKTVRGSDDQEIVLLSVWMNDADGTN